MCHLLIVARKVMQLSAEMDNSLFSGSIRSKAAQAPKGV
jgi:hypothetical protein